MFVKIISLLVLGAVTVAALLMPKPETTDQVPITNNRSPITNPVELGAVRWTRDLEAGKAEAAATGKPLLILFQEVPGCGNCTRYGAVTLRHPLIVEAIETFFVPVCIYNNEGGKDAEALRIFGEKAWNNPVVRIAGADCQDLVPRMADFRSSGELVRGMRAALTKTGQSVPHYLELLDEELAARESGTETATFVMGCFWSGESALGALSGVVETTPGFQNSREVVRVVFDPKKTSRAELESAAKPKGISACAANTGFSADHEPKYYLSQTPWRFVPMTSLQACRANSLVGQGLSPEAVLSPRQIELGRRAHADPGGPWQNAIGAADLAEAWGQAWPGR